MTDYKQKNWKGDWPNRDHLMSTMPRHKFWPDPHWKGYWKIKKLRCRQRGIEFTLTREECLELTMQIHPDRPRRDGYHLGRLDHSKGYVTGNVQWESYVWNCGKKGK